MGYIRFPIESNPEILIQDVYNYIISFAPNWVPADGNLDVWIIRALTSKAAENRDLASDVQDDIFRYFGATLMAIPPLDAIQANADTTWTMVDNIGYTIPIGTNVSIVNSNGDSFPFYTLVDVVVPPGFTVATGVTIRALNPGTESNGLGGAGVHIDLIDVHDFVASVVLNAATDGGQDAETDLDYLNRLVVRLQGLSQRPIIPADFAQAAFTASSEVDRAVAIDLYNPAHNLLTLDEASAETGVSHYTGSNAAVAQSATQAADGANSLRLTASSAADMSAELSTVSANGKPTSPGKTVTGLASFRAGTTSRTVKVGLRWYDGSNTLIGSTVFGSNVTDTNAGFIQAAVTAVAPALAAKVTLVVYVVSPANTEIHYVDKMSLRNGSSTDWVPGGTAETGNDRTVAVAAVNSAGAPVSSQAKNDIDAYLQANREVNFIVHVMDAKYTTIDVATNIVVGAGYNPPDIQSDVVGVVTDYLSPAKWGSTGDAHSWVESPTVYYNELIALVSGVIGVDRVSDLTSNIHGLTPARVDINIDSPAGLTQAGTISAASV